MSAAMGASLLCMVCNLTIGKKKYAGYEAELRAALERAEAARHVALGLADEDARVFNQVIAAYKQPRATEAEKAEYAAGIQRALIDAATVPLRVAELAADMIEIAAQICDKSNKNVISDVALSAIMSRAALEGSFVNVEINLAGMTDPVQRAAIGEQLERHRGALAKADEVVALVRKEIIG